jgi:hypothetical protein
VRRASVARGLEPPPTENVELGRRQTAPQGKLYLYLKQQSYADTWVKGGQVPIELASTYRSIERRGILTPDEVRQYFVRGVNPKDLDGFFKINGAKNFRMIGCTINGKPIDNAIISDYSEDAYLLCLSQTCSHELMEKLEKSVCVEIVDFDLLRESLNRQVGSELQFGPITYTSGADRDHFTKSSRDEWQDEYRLAWVAASNLQQIVEIPRGVAVQVRFDSNLKA